MVIVMRGRFVLFAVAFLMMSCSKSEVHSERGIDYSYGKDLNHEMIVLGDRLENPYKTENIREALKSLYPTKADRVDVKTTDLYVRFLPADEMEYDQLEAAGLHLVDHPLDYDIVVDGDWYHDPVIPEGGMTWQYAVVPPGFEFPDVRYEIIDECYIAEHDSATRASDGIDWEAVEREAYVLTGNADRIPDEPLTKASTKTVPFGRITIVDEHANGGKPFGVAGVRVSCNSFVKFDHCYTDRDGYYTMSKNYSSDLRYRLVFENEKGFSIGFNMVLVPASVSTLGTAGPEGINMTITKESEDKLFRRCVVNNAAYDFYTRCAVNDLNITPPPSDLCIWLFHSLEPGSAVMLHHGAFLQNELLKSFLGSYSSIIEYFAPDITLGMAGKEEYRTIYSTAVHELAHASHFAKAGVDFWNKYIEYIINSYVKTGDAYGEGLSKDAGYCEVGEMWAYYLESRVYKDRYGGAFPTFGTSFWFYPQIFRYLDERGITPSNIFSVLDASVSSRATLKDALLQAYPNKRSTIEQVFNRYR